MSLTSSFGWSSITMQCHITSFLHPPSDFVPECYWAFPSINFPEPFWVLPLPVCPKMCSWVFLMICVWCFMYNCIFLFAPVEKKDNPSDLIPSWSAHLPHFWALLLLYHHNHPQYIIIRDGPNSSCQPLRSWLRILSWWWVVKITSESLKMNLDPSSPKIDRHERCNAMQCRCMWPSWNSLNSLSSTSLLICILTEWSCWMPMPRTLPRLLMSKVKMKMKIWQKVR